MTAISANTVIFSYNTNTINIRVSKYPKLVIVSNHSNPLQSIKHVHLKCFNITLYPLLVVPTIIVPDDTNILRPI